ncbi:MAG: MFS transporter [Puniceicoccales bacterium]|jgi:MFS family permease|nr:MFS transporter [Puniceicoccales bacterium]
MIPDCSSEKNANRISGHSWLNLSLCTFVIVCSAPGHSSGLCAFTEPLLRDTPLTRQDFSSIYALATVLAACLTAWGGRQCDRFGMRRVLLGSFFAFGLVLLLLSGLPLGYRCFSAIGHKLYWGVGLALGFAGLKFLGHNLIPLSSRAIYIQWFPGHRSLAVGCSGLLVTFFFGLAAKSFDWGIGRYGWQWVWGAWGLLSWFLVLPVIFLGLRERGHGVSSKSPSVPSAEGQAPAASFFQTVVASWEFWMLSFGVTLQLLIAHGISLHIVDIYRELRPEFQRVFDIFIPIGIIGALSGFLWGCLLDRISMKHGLLLLYALQFTLLGSFFIPSMKASSAFFVLAMGSSWSLYGILLTAAWPRFVPVSYQGRTWGWVYAQAMLGSAAGPWIFSASRLHGGSYLPAMRWLMFSVVTLAVLSFCCVRREVLAPKA